MWFTCADSQDSIQRMYMYRKVALGFRRTLFFGYDSFFISTPLVPGSWRMYKGIAGRGSGGNGILTLYDFFKPEKLTLREEHRSCNISNNVKNPHTRDHEDRKDHEARKARENYSGNKNCPKVRAGARANASRRSKHRGSIQACLCVFASTRGRSPKVH